MSANSNFNSVANIKVIGVGGGGNNSIQSILDIKLDGLEFIVANTDKQILDKFDPSVTLQLGDRRGIGAGAKPDVGKKAAEYSIHEIKERIKDANLVIITAGMGGGTGTGASPVIAKLAKEQNSLVIAIVTTPFNFEGAKRAKIAREGIEELKKYVDSYIIISNEKLNQAYADASFSTAFEAANIVVKQLIRTVVDIIAVPGIINLDLADLETIIKDAGETIVGIGSASGKHAAKQAMIKAISSPIIESNIEISKAIVYFSSSSKTTVKDFELAIDELKKLTGKNIDVIFGVGRPQNEDSEKLEETYVSVIATSNKQNQETNFLSDNEKSIEDLEENENIEEYVTVSHLFSNKETSHSNNKDLNDDEISLVHKNFRN